MENWIAEHAVPIFAVLSVAIVLAAAGAFLTFQRSGETQHQVRVLEPQVTTINRAICDARSLKSEKKARRCAERIRVGLVNCKRVDRCRAAFLAVLTYPPPERSPSSGTATQEGGAQIQPSTAGQQHAPAQTGAHHGGPKSHHHAPPKHHPHPKPSPAPPPPAPPLPAPEPPAENNGKGNENGKGGGNGTQGGHSSGAGVEVCVLAQTCVGAEVGLAPKGLLP